MSFIWDYSQVEELNLVFLYYGDKHAILCD